MKSLLKNIVGRTMLGGRGRGIVFDHLRNERVYFLKECGSRIFVFYPGDHIGECLMKLGEYQRDLVASVSEILKLKNRLTILELGANIGTQTNYFFDFFNVEQVIAVEPDPENLSLLRMNLALNGIADRVTVLQMAASDVAGALPFAKYRYNSGRSAVISPSVIAEGGDYQVIEVRAERADALAEKVDFVWIDVEEHEISVLKGMGPLLGTPMLLEFSRHAMTDADFQFFLLDVLPHYSRMRVYEHGFSEISIEDLNMLTKQINLLLTR